MKSLAKDFPNIKAGKSKIINLNTILTLYKGTEFFFSDFHGEYEVFLHLLRTTSSVIKNM